MTDRAAGVVLLLFVAAPLAGADFAPPDVRVPDGFSVELAAAPPLVKHPMMAGFDDRGRLFVAESAGKNLRSDKLLKDPPNFVRMLEDVDGDGRFDKSTIFADKMTLPMGALWHRGALYVASPPSIWRLEDTDGDGVADRREEIVNTFGFNGNAASVHGCFLGPCGRIYWCDGRHGHEFYDEKGRLRSKGKAARIFSCLPDGSDVRVFCGGGMDNPVEVDFMPGGEMFGTVNILLSKPRVDCLVHWVEGGVYPRRDQGACIAEFPSTGGLMPPTTKLGHVAVSGMCRYRSAEWGGEFRDNLFITLFNTHQVIRSIPRRSGSTFVTTQQEFLTCDSRDFHPTDVLEDADGSLLVVDTGGWFRIGCPVSKEARPQIQGAIYRVRRKGAHTIDDPRGLKIDFAKDRNKSLDHLDDARPVVREKAIEALAGAKPPAAVRAWWDGKTTARARRNAVWAMARAGDGSLISQALKDRDESVRLAAAHALGSMHRTSAAPFVAALTARLLEDDSPAVRRAAARALGHALAKNTDAARGIKALCDALRNPANDRVLEHSLIFALIRIADTQATAAYLRDENPQVRRAALLALDQMEGGKPTRELVAPLLDTDDAALQQAALQIISREGWAEELVGLMRQWLSSDKPLPSGRAATVRGVLLALENDKKIQSLVSDTLNKTNTPKETRLLLLEAVARGALEELPPAWRSALGQALESSDSLVAAQAVAAIAAKGVGDFDKRLLAISRGAKRPRELRVAALAAIAQRGNPLERDAFQLLAQQIDPDAPPLVRLSAAEGLGAAALSRPQLAELARLAGRAGPLELPALLPAWEKTKDAAAGLQLAKSLAASPGLTALSAARLEKLFAPFPAEVHSAAAPLLKRLAADSREQRRRLEELAGSLVNGDAARGQAVFTDKKTACTACHRVGQSGGKLGPDLSHIGRIREPSDLLEAIVFPSASFARGFESYTVLTAEGHNKSGVISRETADALYLRTAQRAEIRVARDSIEQIAPSRVSVMPQGLHKTMSEEELRDLIAYLRSLR